MVIPIEYDRRYKVNNETIIKMREMRKNGFSYQKIADHFHQLLNNGELKTK